MTKTIYCFNLGEISRVKKLDSQSIGALLTPRLLGKEINKYALTGCASFQNNDAHIIAYDVSNESFDDLQFRLMAALLSEETKWPTLIVLADEKTNQRIKSIFPPGEVVIFNPSAKQSLSLYDIYRTENKVFAGLISSVHLYA